MAMDIGCATRGPTALPLAHTHTGPWPRCDTALAEVHRAGSSRPPKRRILVREGELCYPPPPFTNALEGKGPRRWPQRWLDRRLEDVAKAVRGSYCWLQMPWKLALGIRETVVGALDVGGGYLPTECHTGGSPPPLFQCIPTTPPPRGFHTHTTANIGHGSACSVYP